jgi:hypothetical protein
VWVKKLGKSATLDRKKKQKFMQIKGKTTINEVNNEFSVKQKKTNAELLLPSSK